MGRNPVSVSQRPVPINTSWEDVEDRDNDEEYETDLDAEKRDSNRQQVDERCHQVSAGGPPHKLWVDLLVHQAVAACRIPPQQLEHQSGNH